MRLCITCNDGDSCTEGSIDPGSGRCVHTPLDCDDGDACTVDHCALGNCTHEPVLLDCDDGNLCTEDSCNPATGECDNVPSDCDDGEGCTQDCCDPLLGCLHFPTAQPFTIQAFEDTSGCVGGTLLIPIVLCNDGQCDNDFDWSVTGTTRKGCSYCGILPRVTTVPRRLLSRASGVGRTW